jgi:hypothetical protein
MEPINLPSYIKHATTGAAFNRGCRCDPCKKFMREYATVSRVKTKARNKAYVDEVKSGPCTDCGGRFPTVCMHFDHLDGATKEFEISWAIARTFSLERIKLEIEKCELVCANCHAVRTERRRLEGLAEDGTLTIDG